VPFNVFCEKQSLLVISLRSFHCPANFCSKMVPPTQPKEPPMVASKQQEDKGWLAAHDDAGPSAASSPTAAAKEDPSESCSVRNLERFDDEDDEKASVQSSRSADVVAIQVAVDDTTSTRTTTLTKSDTPYAFLSFFRSKMALLLLVGVLTTGAVALTISLLLSKNSGDSSSAATDAERESLGIRQEIGELLGGEAQSHDLLLKSPSSPYAKALEWIINKDPMKLHPGDANFFQRFITAYLYYATTVKGPWKSCNPAVGEEIDMCYQSVFMRDGGYHDNALSTRWLSSVHECQFAGITCNDDMQITAIQLGKSVVCGQHVNRKNRATNASSMHVLLGRR
jgi:hypothetical protein